MKFVPDAGRILKKAWSVRFIALTGFLIGVDAALPFFAPKEPSRVFATLAGVTSLLAFLARFLPQKGLTDGDDNCPAPSGRSSPGDGDRGTR